MFFVKPEVVHCLEQSNVMIFMRAIDKTHRFIMTEDHVDDSEN